MILFLQRFLSSCERLSTHVFLCFCEFELAMRIDHHELFTCMLDAMARLGQSHVIR
jgi:hypothetical protein